MLLEPNSFSDFQERVMSQLFQCDMKTLFMGSLIKNMYVLFSYNIDSFEKKKKKNFFVIH